MAGGSSCCVGCGHGRRPETAGRAAAPGGCAWDCMQHVGVRGCSVGGRGSEAGIVDVGLSLLGGLSLGGRGGDGVAGMMGDVLGSSGLVVRCS